MKNWVSLNFYTETNELMNIQWNNCTGTETVHHLCETIVRYDFFSNDFNFRLRFYFSRANENKNPHFIHETMLWIAQTQSIKRTDENVFCDQ